MTPQNKTLFISDLHLESERPEIAAQFFQLLKNSIGTIDALYILGDFFESWIGDDDLSPFHQEVIDALKSATTNGLPIYFMHGNRDFLLGKQFFNATGCQFLPDESKILLYNTPVLLMHGDTLCTLDKKYQQSRKKMRNPIIQKLFLLLPLQLRRYIANKMRQTSMQHIQIASAESMDVTQSAVMNVMQKHHVLYLIHGHTHRPAIHQFSIDEHPATRIVLASWEQHGSMLMWDASGNKELIDI